MSLSIFTIPEIIEIAKVSQYLANKDESKGSLFGGVLDPNLGYKIFVIREDVEQLYELDNNNTNGVYNINTMAEYLYGLCQSYGLVSQAIISGGGGSPISPIYPNGYVWTSQVWIFGTETTDINDTSFFTRTILVDAIEVNVMIVNNQTKTNPPEFSFDSSAGEIDYGLNHFFTGDIIAISFYKKLN